MIKKQHRKSTQSSRRHAFASFRERVDAVKIEPSLNLAKRVYDYTDESHFISTLEHWTEVNLSATFTEFVDEVAPVAHSLPQILHHKRQIFGALQRNLSKNDAHSLQPLLEILSQFIHDLGPDFLEFYADALATLTQVALAINPNDLQNNNNSSNSLEWLFNCLTFMFKYLSKYITADPQATFDVLLPILTLSKKTYISRFCGEALSFLIRKMKSDNLVTAIDYLLVHNLATLRENQTYKEVLVIIFAESMKSTKSVFTSKAIPIYSRLLTASLNELQTNIIISGVLADVFHHGSAEAVAPFIKSTLSHLNEALKTCEDSALVFIIEILATLMFAESGKKISDWPAVYDTVHILLDRLRSKSVDSRTADAISYCLTILVRNSDVINLTKNFKLIVDFVSKLNDATCFLPFVAATHELCSSKISTLNVNNHLQDFVNNCSNEVVLKQISFLLSSSSHFASTIVIPTHVQNSIIDSIDDHVSIDNLQDLFWKLNLLRTAQDASVARTVFKILDKILALHDGTTFFGDITGVCLSIIANTDSALTAKQLANLIDNFKQSQKSTIFIESATQILKKSTITKQDFFNIVDLCADNLNLDDNKCRGATIELIISLYAHIDEETPDIFNQMRLIEQVPLSLNNGRDIKLRIRNLILAYSNEANKTELQSKVLVNFLFGMLTNKFQPSWEGVFENITHIKAACEELIWESCFRFMTLDYDNQETNYSDLPLMMLDDDSVEMNFADERMKNSFGELERKFYTKFRSVPHSIIDHIQEESTNLVYSGLMRHQVIQILLAIPEIAEHHSQQMLTLVFEEEAEKSSWTIKDRNSYLSVFAKFKNLKSMKNKDRFYDKVLNILGSKRPQAQKLALDVIINFKVGAISKYKDNLKNLTDDTLFRDELTTFLTRDSDSTIEEADLEVLMPLILRILFGRAQGSTSSNSKAGKKNAVLTVLPTFTDEQVIQFLKLGSDKIGFSSFQNLGVDMEANFQYLRRMNGFISLINEVYDSLGFKFKHALSQTIEPLVYCLAIAQARVGAELEHTDTSDIELKTAKNIRQVGMRCWNKLFSLLGDSYDWNAYIDPIYEFVLKPRMENFAEENLQQTSSLMKLMTGWIKIPHAVKFLLIDDLTPAKSIIDLLSNRKAKESVVVTALTFAADCLQTPVDDEDYYLLLAHLVESLLSNLPEIIETSTDDEIISKAVTILLLLIDGEYIDNQPTRVALLDAVTKAMDKPVNKIPVSERRNMLISLSSLISDYEGTFEQFAPYYKTFSKSFKEYSDKHLRAELVGVFNSIGVLYPEYSQIAEILEDINSFTNERMGEPDFERRIVGYKKINDELYSQLTPTQWLPIVYCALFFINDEEELVVRSNATYILNHFVDAIAEKDSEDAAKPFVHLLKDIILPNLRLGVRVNKEVVQAENIGALGYIVKNSKYFNDLDDMKVLLFGDDDEANFFVNICHIQMHRRQRAIKRVADLRNQLSANSISHYILPIIESYAYNTEERLRNVAFEASQSIGSLVRCITWNQYKAIMKRYISKTRVAKDESLKVSVHLVVAVAKSLYYSIVAKREERIEDALKEIPSKQEDLDKIILEDFVPSISKVLDTRNDETIVDRIQLSEALVGLIRCISENKIEEQLPGLLTSTCQVLRSRSEELRNASRKSLCHIAAELGAKYIKFLIQELKGALTRGSQIHVLSFTLHSLLVAVENSIEHGDLDDSASLIVEIIMEDTFGAAGQEKDAEGYTSKMKEVKHKKSNDSGELLTANISLSQFGRILNPIKLVLQERISLKVQNRLDELLRRYALGLNHNEESTSRNILLLSYQINKQAIDVFNSGDKKDTKNPAKESEDHFLVKLDARPIKTQVDYTQYTHTLQKFSFELLRAAISRHESLLTVGNMQEFVPLLETGVNSEHEGLAATSFRLLHSIVRLPFSERTNGVFKTCARKALSIVKDSPTTNTEVAQASLRYLATLIRHKPEITLKDTAISYVLVRIQPDLEEPHRQGLAFNFLKSVVSQHVLLPEVYDVMESVSKIMVVNHNREIRDMARSVYFQFLMEYDQSRGKLEKQFKFLVNNLNYATADGRISVLELIHSVVNKAGEDLLNKLSTSFFVALSNMLINDDSSKCREMAATVISNILAKLKKLDTIEQYLLAWISQESNEALLRCGLNLYKLYIGQFKLANEKLDLLALEKISKVFKQAANHEEGEDVEWQLVYQCLSVFSSLCSIERVSIVSEKYESLWRAVIDILLFPHAWVRLNTSRLIGVLLTNLDNCQFEVSNYEVQTIAYRLLRQLAAPAITEELATQATKNLVLIAMKWEKEQTEFESPESFDAESKYKSANEFLVNRAASIIRQEARDVENSKKAAMKLCAMLVQVLKGEFLEEAVQEILLSLYKYTESEDKDDELVVLAVECNQIIENKLGGSKYTEIYSKVQRTVNARRQDRKTKRAQLAVTAPDLAAKRKLKKHARSREKRKHEKDENGYYRKKSKHR